MSGRWVNIADAEDLDRAAAARFSYFLRLVRMRRPQPSNRPGPAPSYNQGEPWLRPLQRAWLLQYIDCASVDRGLR